MTDKPIIIDGVDVSECMYFDYDEGYNQETEEFVKGACKCITAHDSYGEFMYYGICKDRNCYYKQLKRKEQECERLRFPMTDTNYAILTKEEFEQLDQLKAESKEINEKLKEKFSEYTLKSSFTIAFQDDLLNKYKQALQEIKNLASCGKDMYMERGKYENYEAMAEWMKNQFYFILNKISEVEDDSICFNK